MKVYVNRTAVEAAEGTTLSDLLAAQGIAADGTAVAVNNRVVPRDAWTTTILEAEAKITVIRAVCGG